MNALLLMLAVVSAQTPPPNDSESARQSFQLGVECRDDSQTARPHFATAAWEYRQLWEQSSRRDFLRLMGIGGAVVLLPT